MNYLEQNMIVWWIFTETKAGCAAFVDVMHDVSEAHKDNPEEYKMIEFLRDLAWRKGQIMCMKENEKNATEAKRAEQLRECQKAWAGDWDYEL